MKNVLILSVIVISTKQGESHASEFNVGVYLFYCSDALVSDHVRNGRSGLLLQEEALRPYDFVERCFALHGSGAVAQLDRSSGHVGLFGANVGAGVETVRSFLVQHHR